MSFLQLYLRIVKILDRNKWQEYVCVGAFLLTVSCQSQMITNQQTESNNPNVAVESAQSMLIQLNDLGWLPGDQREIEDPGSLSSNTPYEAVYTTLISPIPKPHSGRSAKPPPDPRIASEVIWVYQDEETAKQAFEEIQAAISSLSPDGLSGYLTSGPNPSIINVLATCRQKYDGRFGSYQGCNARMQYDRYLVRIVMVVDGQEITMEDWTTMFQLVQDRLVERVGQEQEN